MKRVIHILYDTDQPIWNYVWRAALISMFPTIVIGLLVTFTMPVKSPSFDGSIAINIFGIFIFSPWVETLLMWPILWVLKRFMHRTLTIAFISAVIWAVIHSSVALAWGLVIWWSFFVFSVCFIEWEKKSKKQAIVATASVHMCHNFIPLIAILLAK